MNYTRKYNNENVIGNRLTAVQPSTEEKIAFTNNGLKIYLPFLFFGWEGYETIINKQMEMGRLLRKKLTKNGWKIYNNTKKTY